MSEENVVRRETLLMEIRQYNQVLVPKGLCLLPLRFTDKSALLYLYRPRDLERDLQDRLATEILRHAGYVCGSSEQCLMKLIERLRAYDEFPHEIGLFLGYPPGDVEGFLRDGGRHCKLCGPWKVYDNVEEAARRFAAFHRCRDALTQRVDRGIPLSRVFPAVS